jgi:iron complex outermembrane receptor protein
MRREYAEVLNPDEVELYFKLTTWNGDVKYLFPEFNGWNLSAGISSQYQTNSNHGKEFLIPEYSMSDLGGFVFGQKDFGLLLISGGLRYDVRSLESDALYLDSNELPATEANAAETKFAPFGRTFSNLSASIGASYKAADAFTLRANLATGFRVPNLSELSSNGKHEGTFRYENGNPALSPERSVQADAGLSFNSEHMSFDIDGFYNSISDYVYLEKLNSYAGGDSIIDPTDPAAVFNFVQGNASLYGGEISMDIHPHPYDWLHFENSFSYVRGTQSGQPDSMSNLPFMPAPKFQSEIRAQFASYKSMRNCYAKVEGEYFFTQENAYVAYGTETATDSYFLMNAGIGSEFAGGDNKIFCKVYLSVNNLLDTKYQSHLSRLKYAPVNPVTGKQGVFSPGRNVSLRVVVPMEF